MALTLGLGFRLFGIDRLSGTLEKVGGRFRRLTRDVRVSTKAMSRAFKRSKVSSGDLLVAGAVAAGFGAIITKAAFDAGEFTRQMRFLGVISGASAKDLEDLEAQVLSLSTQFGVLPIDVAKTAVALTRLGFTGKEVKDLLVPTLGLIATSMGKLGPEQAGKLLGQTLKSFGLGASEAVNIGDQLSTIVARTAIDFDKMGLAVGTAGGFVAQFGGTTSEMLTFLGLAADVISRTERGATAMRNVFRDLADVQRQVKIETQLGIQVVDQQTGKFKNVLDILEALFAKFGEMGQAQRSAAIQTIFSQEAAGGLLAMMKRLESGIKTASGETLFGVEALRFLEKQVRAGTVSLAEFVKAALGPLPGQLAISRASMQRFSISIGRGFGVVIGPLISTVTFLFDAFTTVITKTGVFGKGLAIVLGVLGVVIGLIAPPLITAAIFMKLFGASSIFAAITTLGFKVALLSLFKVMVIVTGGLALIGLAVGAIAQAFGAFNTDDATADIEKVTAAMEDLQGAAPGGIAVAAITGAAPRTDTTAGIEALGEGAPGGAAIAAFDQLPAARATDFARGAAVGDPGDRNVIVNLILDGKKIGEAIAKVNDRKRQREFKTKTSLA